MLSKFSGHVHGGQQPVAGSQVYLYAVSNVSGGPSVSLLNAPQYVLTDANGNFSITNDYTCPPGADVYLLALGGNPGLSGANSKIALASGLGPCSALSASSYFSINEVTTVALAFSLSAYATSDTQIGSASDLTSLFANISNFVDPASGFARVPTQANAVPQAKLNSLADSLASCINSSGIGGPCAALSAAANPGSGAPNDTFQAALNVAQNPSLNVAAIYNLAPANPPFTPTLSSVPSDWNLDAVRTDGCILADTNTYTFSTTEGDIFVEFRPDVAPLNVANFLSYVNSGSYTNSIFHRSVAGFITQGGGYFVNGNQNLDVIPAQQPVADELTLANTRGTLAMANTGPNSATTQFFFNAEDNTSINNGQSDYSVFGQIVSLQGPTICGTQSLAIMDALNAVPTFDLSSSLGPAFSQLPLLNYTAGQTVLPANLVYVNAITPTTNVKTTTATPLFSPASGTYTGPQVISLLDTTPGAVISYTIGTPSLDGSYSFNGPVLPYTGRIPLSASGAIRAYASAAGYPNNSVYNYGLYQIQ